jgi:hypothetical protein
MRLTAKTRRSVKIICCFEAGRDGFWLHRLLIGHGTESYRALEATRPACRDYDRLALLLGAVLLFERRLAEALLELHDITLHRLNLMKQHGIPALLSGVS